MQNNIEIKKLATEKLNNEPLETLFRFSEFEHIKMLEFINEKIRKTKIKTTDYYYNYIVHYYNYSNEYCLFAAI